MDYLLRLKLYARLAILLGLSLCVHLAVLLALSWSPLGERQSMPADNPASLTVILPGAQPAAAPPEKAGAETDAPRDGNEATADKPGNEFALAKAGLSLPVDRHYFRLADLDERPFVVQDIPPNPPELRTFPQGGKVVMRLWIDADGRVVNAEPVSSELPQAFIDSARSGFLSARFAPGRIRGEAVDAVMDVVLDYAPAF